MVGDFAWLATSDCFEDIKKPAAAGFFIGIRPVL